MVTKVAFIVQKRWQNLEVQYYTIKTEYLLNDHDLTSAEIIRPTFALSLPLVARDWSSKPRDQPTAHCFHVKC